MSETAEFLLVVAAVAAFFLAVLLQWTSADIHQANRVVYHLLAAIVILLYLIYRKMP